MTNSTEQDNEQSIEDLLAIAEGKLQQESRPLNDIEKFITLFEITPSETRVIPFWPIYRAYRLWCRENEKECLTKYLFRREFVKYFRKADKYGTTVQKSYFINPGKLDLSDNAYWAEKRFESDERKRKEREHKQRYPNNYPDHPYKKIQT